LPYGNMLAASLHISQWTGQKTDQKTTAETLLAKGADSDAGKFSKLLVPKKLLSELDKAHFDARRDFRRFTLPFEHGMGLVSGEMFDEFRAAMTAHRATFEAAAQKFVDDVYPGVLADATARQGALFDAADFPTQAELRDRFQFRLSISPVPHAAELKLSSVSAAVEAELRSEYDQLLRDRLAEAQLEVWLRVMEPVAKLADVLSSPDKVFKASTVESVRAIAEMAPKMLVEPDDELTAVCQRVSDVLAGLDAKVLRESNEVRADAATSVSQVRADIERKLKWFAK